MIVLFSCKKNYLVDTPLRQDDSLAILIKETMQEKRKIIKFKKKFEKSYYAKALMEYKPTIKKYSKRYGLDWRLIVAQIMQESRFRNEAESPVGARGLMQLMPQTASEIKRELDFLYILQNPRENIAAGIYHMKKIYELYNKADYINRTKLSLASYNCGVGRVQDAQDIARFYKKSPYQWQYISEYLTYLKYTDWELHLQVWPLGKPKHNYFYGYNETLTYVDNIWEMYQIFKQIL